MVNKENSLGGKVPYQEAVECLLYLAQATRPDIASVVNNIIRFNANHSDVQLSIDLRLNVFLNIWMVPSISN